MSFPKEPFKVFISHSTNEDGELANWIADALDLLHLRAFVYERYYKGGQNRFEAIKNLVKQCPLFLVLLTKAGIQSQWVNQEIGYAVGMDKYIIPVIEMDNVTGRRLESKGFVELNDPINFTGNRIELMSSIIYTFYSILLSQGGWTDKIFLPCKCGYAGDASLGYERWLRERQKSPNHQALFPVWTCPNCKRNVVISFPDCHQLPQFE